LGIGFKTTYDKTHLYANQLHDLK